MKKGDRKAVFVVRRFSGTSGVTIRPRAWDNGIARCPVEMPDEVDCINYGSDDNEYNYIYGEPVNEGELIILEYVGEILWLSTAEVKRHVWRVVSDEDRGT
jgi:hypothetical protein